MNKILLPFLLMLCFCLPETSLSQNYLSQPLSLEAHQTSMSAVLAQLEEKGRFRFSYNALLFDENKSLSISVKNQSLDKILYQLFGEEFSWKVVGTHVILQARSKPRQEYQFTVYGNITGIDGQALEQAIVYEINRNGSSISSMGGSYQIQIKSKRPSFGLSFSCENYQDTVVLLSKPGNQQINIRLYPIHRPSLKLNRMEITRSVSIQSTPGLAVNSGFEQVKMVKLLVPKDARFIASQINTFEKRFAQASFVPFLGSNYRTTGLVTNHISFNLLAGYAAGLEGFELGGVANIIRKDVDGTQIAGMTNIVGGNMAGFQIGGVANINKGKASGFQIGGVFNSVQQEFQGLQIGGVFNVSALNQLVKHKILRHSNQPGLALDTKAFTTSGRKPQFQIGGVANFANELSGLQLAGVINVNSGTLKGLQLSGFYNQTKVLSGVQFGIVNYCDSIHRGLPIGLINIVRSGYRSLQFSTNETFYANAAFKTGGRHFYSLLGVSMGPYLGATYGIGLCSNPNRQIAVFCDLTSSSVFGTSKPGSGYSGDLYSAKSGINIRLSKAISISTGPSWNYFIPYDQAQSKSKNALPQNPYLGSRQIFDAIQKQEEQQWLGWFFSLNV